MLDAFHILVFNKVYKQQKKLKSFTLKDIRNATSPSTTTKKIEESEAHTTTNYHDVPINPLNQYSSGYYFIILF